MPKYESREIRVFISSTFVDMHREREVLVKQVFPDLRRKCRDRDVELTEVDLRWGVDEESKLDEAVHVCLREIDVCHPFFIGLMGERYGRPHPPEKFRHLHDKKPEFCWLETCEDCSVTELEILHAAFIPLEEGRVSREYLSEHLRFYFRDPAYPETLPPEERPLFDERPENRERLNALKTRIRESGLPVTEYGKPEDLGKLISEHLWEMIDRKFPKAEQPTPLQREAMEHEAFARSRTRIYIERREDMRRLDDHARGDALPLTILGESGCGKSALLANWSLKYREANPDDLLIFHFIGSSSGSTDYALMLRRVMAELKAYYEMDDEIPTDPRKMAEAFPQGLAKAYAQGRTILILDGLNQLGDIDHAGELGWLPEFVPANVRVFFRLCRAWVWTRWGSGGNGDSSRWNDSRRRSREP